MPRKTKYPGELLDRDARMSSTPAAIAHVARDLGIHRETLRKWVRKTEADGGKRKELLSSQEREELKALRGEVRELRHSEAGRLDLTFHFFATPSALLRPGEWT